MEMDCLPARKCTCLSRGRETVNLFGVAAKSIPKLTNQLCGDLQPASCLSMQGRWRSPYHSWMSDRTQKQATAKTAWATISTDTCLKC